MAAVEILAVPGGGPPPHVHANEDEMWFVLDGEFEVLQGEETLRLTAGGFAFVPRGTLHRFENVSDTPSRVLVVFTPGGFEDFFFEAGLPVVEGETPPPLGARGDRAQPRRGRPPRHGRPVAAGVLDDRVRERPDPRRIERDQVARLEPALALERAELQQAALAERSGTEHVAGLQLRVAGGVLDDLRP